MDYVHSETDTETIAEIQVSYHPKLEPSEQTVITCSRDAFLLISSVWDSGRLALQESFVALYLNRAQRVIGYHLHSIGTTGAVTVEKRILLAIALKANATGIVLAHNHPSGRLRPSEADLDLTKQMKEGGKLFNINILDHLIISSQGYYSFADEGTL
ncbi:MAG: JAB domain-containing protein [Bacteroidota bacterium]